MMRCHLCFQCLFGFILIFSLSRKVASHHSAAAAQSRPEQSEAIFIDALAALAACSPTRIPAIPEWAFRLLRDARRITYSLAAVY